MSAAAEIKRIVERVPDLQGDDAQFLAGVIEKFPRVAAGFSDFTSFPPRERILKAAGVLEFQPRSGWLRFDIEPRMFNVLATHGGEYTGPRSVMVDRRHFAGESVLRHSVEACELFACVFRNTPHVQLGVEIMKFHDFSEAVCGDFTPKDNLSRGDKERLERISIGLLTEGRKGDNLLALHVFNCQQMYDGAITDFAPVRDEMLAKIRAHPEQRSKPFVKFAEILYSGPLPDLGLLRAQAKDIDQLQMAIEGLKIIEHEHYEIPRADAIKEMDGFWEYVDKKITTAEARKEFEVLTKLYHRATGRGGVR